jgi:catechol 2,3-dioxygenase-like lactoylglutathione lyase family enzyme
MERFYVDLMGYRIEWKPDPDNSYLTNGEDSLALHVEPRVESASETSRLDHIGLLLDAPDDVDAWAAHLRGQGVTIAAPPRTHRDGCRSCYVLDPEGNKIQLLWHPALARPS